MRIVGTAAVLFVAAAAFAYADEQAQPISDAKVSAERLKKDWSLTAVSAVPGKDSGESTEVRVLVRFDKDLSKAATDELSNSFILPSGPGRPRGFNPADMVKVFFLDADNVIVHQNHIRKIDGAMTGKAGDAFRVVTDCDDAVISKVKRIELRHMQQEPKK